MYHSVMKMKLRQVFNELNRGNYEPLLGSLAPRFRHSFAGQHCLGGSRTSIAAYRSWFKRLFEVCPGIQFEYGNLVVQGPPWNTWVTVEWQDHVVTRDGVERRNSGVHVIRFKWAKATEIRVYLDTSRIEQLCAAQAAHGIAAAVAAPLVD